MTLKVGDHIKLTKMPARISMMQEAEMLEGIAEDLPVIGHEGTIRHRRNSADNEASIVVKFSGRRRLFSVGPGNVEKI